MTSDAATPISRSRRLLFWAMLVAFQFAVMAGAFVVYGWLKPPTGADLNRACWQANFSERGFKPPAGEPREGDWAWRLAKRPREPHLGWVEKEIHLPGLLEVDNCGMQRAGVTEGPRLKLLILGGSTAGGYSAATIETTYFAALARTLHAELCPVEIVVLAAAGWKTAQEVEALRLRGLATEPDVVLHLDGHNDLVLGSTAKTLYGRRTNTRDGSPWTLLYHAHDYAARVAAYRRNLTRAHDLLTARGVHAVFALQPILFEKHPLSRLERRLERAILAPHTSKLEIQASYEAMREALRALAQSPSADFIDCSRAFAGERATLFTEGSHFADPGHELLAACLARELMPILRSRCRR